MRNTLMLILTTLLVGLTGCQPEPGEIQPTPASIEKPLNEFQQKLLNNSFKAVSKMPDVPHLKNRTAAQENIINVYLELDQPALATGQLIHISNWRRGTASASIALYYAERGERQAALELLSQAEAVYALATEDWFYDRLGGYIAKVYSVLDENEKKVAIQSGLTEAVVTDLITVEAQECTENEFDALMDRVDRLGQTENFEFQKSAIKASMILYDRFYQDENKRNSIEEIIYGFSTYIPMPIKFEFESEMASIAARKGDKDNVAKHIAEAAKLVEANKLVPRRRIPFLANLAKLYVLNEQRDDAEKILEQAMAEFTELRGEIVNIWRAETITPIAEVYCAIDEPEKAASIYLKALNDGSEQPNARPRAEDLAGTCSSMALNDFEPDAEMWNLIKTIQEGLVAPW